MTRNHLVTLLTKEHGVEHHPDGIYYCDCGRKFPNYHKWAVHVAGLICEGFAS